MYNLFQEKVRHCTPEMSNQRKWPINNDELWYEKVVQKIALPKPIHRGRDTSVTVSFKVNDKIQIFRYILETLQC